VCICYEDALKLSQSLFVLVDLLVIFGFDTSLWTQEGKFSRESLLSDTLLHWLVCASESGWMPFMKYKTNAFFASSEELGGLPDKPFLANDNPSHLVGGSAGRFIKMLLRSELRDEFLQSILLLKKGLPRPGPALLLASAVKTYHYLTSVHPVPDSVIVEEPGVVFTRQLMADEIVRTAKEIFGGHKIAFKDILRPIAPTFNSTFVSSRGKFGAFGELLRLKLLKDHKVLRPVVENDESVESDFYVRSVANYHKLKKDLDTIYMDVYFKNLKRAMVEKPDVSILPLPESLKVRSISKGPVHTYFALQPIQKFLHTVLKKTKCFKLTGEKVDREVILNSLFSRQKFGNLQCGTGPDGANRGFLSVDYAAATDSIDPYFSDLAVKTISECVSLPESLATLFTRSLTGHVMSIDRSAFIAADEDGCEGLAKHPLIPQLWGQLMGSVTSFIILCVINAAVIRAAYELNQKVVVKLNDCPLMINGDDGLTLVSLKGKHTWEQIASLVGFKPSPGKVYWSRGYFNINSAGYRLISGSIKTIAYVNMGLVCGLKRSGGKVGILDVHDDSVGSRHRDMMFNLPPALEFRKRAHGIFVKYNRSVLDSFTLPWFIPENLGGWGLSSLYGLRVIQGVVTPLKHFVLGPSDLDMRIASKFVSSSKPSGVRSIPSSGEVVARSIWEPSVKEATCYIKKLSGVLDLTDRLLDDDAKIRGFFDVATIFTQPSLVLKKAKSTSLLQILFKAKMIKLSKKELSEYGWLTSESAKAQIRTLRGNEKVWRDNVHKAQGLAKALPLVDLELSAVVLPVLENKYLRTTGAGSVGTKGPDRIPTLSISLDKLILD